MFSENVEGSYDGVICGNTPLLPGGSEEGYGKSGTAICLCIII
jgi:hypothetical protein